MPARKANDATRAFRALFLRHTGRGLDQRIGLEEIDVAKCSIGSLCVIVGVSQRSPPFSKNGMMGLHLLPHRQADNRPRLG